MVAPKRDRLRRAFKLPAETAAAPPRADRGDVRAFLRARAAGLGARPARPRVELPPGQEVATVHGPIWRRELRYGPDWVHGDVRLADARCLAGERLAILAKEPRFATLRAEQCLFLDTETTGLSGGAGTVVFAYGLAFFRGEEFVVEQLFLRDFGEEPAVLRHVAARLWQFPVAVTFVGKSYDRHRIATRMTLHKLRSAALTAPHLDLYHLARREYGKELPDTRLATVEQHRLGLRRESDLPGSEAPVAFLDWIRDGTGAVDRVLEHNRLDVLSLCALLARLAGVRQHPAGG